MQVREGVFGVALETYKAMFALVALSHKLSIYAGLPDVSVSPFLQDLVQGEAWKGYGSVTSPGHNNAPSPLRALHLKAHSTIRMVRVFVMLIAEELV